MNRGELAKKIINLVGGPNNIQLVWNCMTRIRFNLLNYDIVKVDELKNIPQIVDIQQTQSQFQIIVGNNVEELTEEINKQLGEGNKNIDLNKKTKKKTGIKGKINSILEVIAAIFSPILPAIIGAGMMKCIISLIDIFNLLPKTNGVYIVFTMIGDVAFYFLPMLLAVSAARKFKVNEFIAVCLAGILMSPVLIGGAAESLKSIKFLIFDIPYMDYSSSVIPIILGVWLMSYISKFVNRIVPAMLKAILSSVLVLIITVPIVLIVIAPLGFYIGEYLSKGLIWLFANAGPFAGALLAGFNPFIIMTGMHYAFMPAAIQSIQTNGFDNFWLPFALISNIAQAGAIFAVFVKTRKKSDKTIALSTGLSAIFGISEPGMYGVTLKLKKPLYAAMGGSAIAGFVAVLFKVKTFNFVAPSIFALPTYVSSNGNKNNLYIILLSLMVAFIFSFIFTMILKFNPTLTKEDSEYKKSSEKKVDENIKRNLQLTDDVVVSPLSGEIIPMSEIPDKTFAENIVGKGIAILPKDETVKSPINGTVSVLFSTKHAIGITSNSGAEILIHIGIDTVELEGEGFEALVSVGDKIKKGQNIIKFNKDYIESKGYNIVTPIIITNYNDFKSMEILVSDNKKISSGDNIVKLYK